MRPVRQQFNFLAIVAGPTDVTPWFPAVARTRIIMNAVAGKAREFFFAPDHHVTNVLDNVPIHRIQLRDRGIRKIDRKVAEQIIARHEVIWKRHPGATRATRPNVA